MPLTFTITLFTTIYMKFSFVKDADAAIVN